MRNEKGQIAIFVIIAVMLVAVVAFVFVALNKSNPIISTGGNFNPENFIDSCIREAVKEKVDVMLPQGGFLEPKDYKEYNNIKVTYLCKNINYYEPCVNQHPVLASEIKEEIKNNIDGDVTSCFLALKNEMEKRKYVFSGGEQNISVELKPGIVETVVSKNVLFSKGESENRFTSFRSELRNPIYDLAKIAQEIVKQESKYCYFSDEGYSLLYNKFKVERKSLSEGTKIYNILDKKTGKEMNIAIRGCALPQGI